MTLIFLAFCRNVERNVGVNWEDMEMENMLSPKDTVIVKQPNEKVYYFDKETYYS